MHLRALKTNSDVAEHHGAKLYEDQGLIEHEIAEFVDKGIVKTKKEINTIEKNKSMAVALIMAADQNRYKPLLTSIRD